MFNVPLFFFGQVFLWLAPQMLIGFHFTCVKEFIYYLLKQTYTQKR